MSINLKYFIYVSLICLLPIPAFANEEYASTQIECYGFFSLWCGFSIYEKNKTITNYSGSGHGTFFGRFNGTMNYRKDIKPGPASITIISGLFYSRAEWHQADSNNQNVLIATADLGGFGNFGIFHISMSNGKFHD